MKKEENFKENLIDKEDEKYKVFEKTDFFDLEKFRNKELNDYIKEKGIDHLHKIFKSEYAKKNLIGTEKNKEQNRKILANIINEVNNPSGKGYFEAWIAQAINEFLKKCVHKNDPIFLYFAPITELLSNLDASTASATLLNYVNTDPKWNEKFSCLKEDNENCDTAIQLIIETRLVLACLNILSMSKDKDIATEEVINAVRIIIQEKYNGSMNFPFNLSGANFTFIKKQYGKNALLSNWSDTDIEDIQEKTCVCIQLGEKGDITFIETSEKYDATTEDKKFPHLKQILFNNNSSSSFGCKTILNMLTCGIFKCCLGDHNENYELVKNDEQNLTK